MSELPLYDGVIFRCMNHLLFIHHPKTDTGLSPQRVSPQRGLVKGNLDRSLPSLNPCTSSGSTAHEATRALTPAPVPPCSSHRFPPQGLACLSSSTSFRSQLRCAPLRGADGPPTPCTTAPCSLCLPTWSPASCNLLGPVSLLVKRGHLTGQPSDKVSSFM